MLLLLSLPSTCVPSQIDAVLLARYHIVNVLGKDTTAATLCEKPHMLEQRQLSQALVVHSF
jgi:hypothetical protein